MSGAAGAPPAPAVTFASGSLAPAVVELHAPFVVRGSPAVSFASIAATAHRAPAVAPIPTRFGGRFFRPNASTIRSDAAGGATRFPAPLRTGGSNPFQFRASRLPVAPVANTQDVASNMSTAPTASVAAPGETAALSTGSSPLAPPPLFSSIPAPRVFAAPSTSGHAMGCDALQGSVTGGESASAASDAGSAPSAPLPLLTLKQQQQQQQQQQMLSLRNPGQARFASMSSVRFQPAAFRPGFPRPGGFRSGFAPPRG